MLVRGGRRRGIGPGRSQWRRTTPAGRASHLRISETASENALLCFCETAGLNFLLAGIEATSCVG